VRSNHSGRERREGGNLSLQLYVCTCDSNLNSGLKRRDIQTFFGTAHSWRHLFKLVDIDNVVLSSPHTSIEELLSELILKYKCSN